MGHGHQCRRPEPDGRWDHLDVEVVTLKALDASRPSLILRFRAVTCCRMLAEMYILMYISLMSQR